MKLSVYCFVNSVVLLSRDLLACGDIESNPGPLNEDMLKELLEGQKKLTSVVECVQESQVKIERRISGLVDRIDSLEQKLNELNSLSTEVKNMKLSTSKLEKQVSTLIDKVDDLENRSRRNNLIIYGLEEPFEEKYEDLKAKVQDDIFQQKLEITVTGIERCHRLGKKTNDKPRPVIIKFLDYREKTNVLSSAFKLKGSTLSLSEDFSKQVRETRRQLWKSSEEERLRGCKTRLVYDKLKVDDVLFAWDERKGSRFRLNKKSN